MIRGIIIGLISMGMLCSCALLSGKDKRRAQLHLQIGAAHLQKGNYPAALAELLKAEEHNPSDPLIQSNLGLAYFVRGKFDLAEKHTRLALDLKPSFTEARNNLGRILIEQGKLDEAIKELTIASNDLTYRQPAKTYANLGLAYFKRGDYQLSEEFLKRSIQLETKDCISFNYYGRSLYEQRHFAEAARSLDQAIPFCNRVKFDEPLYYSALAYYQLGDREKSNARLEEMLSLYPNGKYAGRAKEMLKLLQ